MALTAFPGGDLMDAGLADLAAGVDSVPALLVSIGASRLRRAGVPVGEPLADAQMRLYLKLADEDQDTAHGCFNALIRRLVSFERAAEQSRRE
jgi:hypothetical protein